MSVDNEGRMVLHYAIVQRYSQVIPMLLLAGADVLRRDNHSNAYDWTSQAFHTIEESPCYLFRILMSHYISRQRQS